MKRAILSTVICLALAAAGAVVVWGAAKGTKQSALANGNHAERIPNVKIKVLQAEELRDRLSLTGTVFPWQDITISAEVAGKIDDKQVEAGERVKAGQEMFRIDSDALQASLEQAEAQARLAGQDFDRIQRLVERGASTRQDQDSAVAKRDVASASLRATRIQVAKSIVNAPIDGVVDRVFEEQDEFVDVGRPLVRLVQLDKVKVKVGVAEREIPNFSVGDKVEVRLDAYSHRKYSGVVHTISPTADLATHTFTTEIAVDNQDGSMMPGMIARVDLVRKVYPKAILIPIFSAILLDDKRYVFVEQNGSAELRPIETGVLQEDHIQVTKGLAPGDHLIVVGQHDVRPGEAVRVQETLQ